MTNEEFEWKRKEVVVTLPPPLFKWEDSGFRLVRSKK